MASAAPGQRWAELPALAGQLRAAAQNWDKEESRAALLAPLFAQLRLLLAALFRLLLRLVPDDALLALGGLRRGLLWVLGPSAPAQVLRQAQVLRTGVDASTPSFDAMGYHVSPEARQLLLQACLHRLAAAQPAAFTAAAGTGAAAAAAAAGGADQAGIGLGPRFAPPPGAQPHWALRSLPPVGHVLLQAAGEHSQRYLECVAAAAAHELGCTLLVIDDAALARIAAAVLRRAARGPRQGQGQAKHGLGDVLLGWFLSGGRVALAWDIVYRAIARMHAPVLIYVRSATLCCVKNGRSKALI